MLEMIFSRTRIISSLTPNAKITVGVGEGGTVQNAVSRPPLEILTP